MPRTRPPYPEGFRREAIRLARLGGTFVWQYNVTIAGGVTESNTIIKRARLDGTRVLSDVPRACGAPWRDAGPAPRPGGGIAYVGCSHSTGSSAFDHSYDQITLYGFDGSQMVLAEAEDQTFKAPSWDSSGRLIVAVVSAPTSFFGGGFSSRSG